MHHDAEQSEKLLSGLDKATRLKGLHELLKLSKSGLIQVERPSSSVNMHCHTFHSYNAHGFSPSRVAWETYRRGLMAAGIVDFDVLDGLDETIAASDALRFRLTVGIETRVYVPEFEKLVLSSPNEPGVAYYMGQGFVRGPVAGSPAALTLKRMRECAAARNIAVMAKVNEYLRDVTSDYAKDVLPLTPSGNATERHMLQAYETKAKQTFPDATRLVHFWAEKMLMSPQEVERLQREPVVFRDTLRKKLMKYGGPGYVAPDPKSFPLLSDAEKMIIDCGAIPMYAWLDGTNSGEEDAELLLAFFGKPGRNGLNIIPDRNWNLKDPQEKSRKTENLNKIVKVAREKNLPICVGTEMNSYTQPMVDHFDAPEMSPHREVFIEGAMILWGHSLLQRHGGFGYLSAQANAAFGQDAKKKNEFFAKVGKCAVPTGATIQSLASASHAGDVRKIISLLSQ